MVLQPIFISMSYLTQSHSNLSVQLQIAGFGTGYNEQRHKNMYF